MIVKQSGLKKDNKDLRLIIEQKDKIFRAIEMDLVKRYLLTLKELQINKTIHDFEISPEISIFKINGDGNPFTTIYYSGHHLNKDIHNKDNNLYNLNIFGIDLKICNMTWHMIDKVGLNNIDSKFIYWSNIEILNQKFFAL